MDATSGCLPLWGRSRGLAGWGKRTKGFQWSLLYDAHLGPSPCKASEHDPIKPSFPELRYARTLCLWWQYFGMRWGGLGAKTDQTARACVGSDGASVARLPICRLPLSLTGLDCRLGGVRVCWFFYEALFFARFHSTDRDGFSRSKKWKKGKSPLSTAMRFETWFVSKPVVFGGRTFEQLMRARPSHFECDTLTTRSRCRDQQNGDDLALYIGGSQPSNLSCRWGPRLPAF